MVTKICLLNSSKKNTVAILLSTWNVACGGAVFGPDAAISIFSTKKVDLRNQGFYFLYILYSYVYRPFVAYLFNNSSPRKEEHLSKTCILVGTTVAVDSWNFT